MKYRYIITTIVFSFVFGYSAFSQKATSLRLNEFMVHNETNYEDNYGNRNGWVEIFNAAYGTTDIAGCYLTNDKNDLKKYPIPKGDASTRIMPQQMAVFFADSIGTHGTYHLNFTLRHTNFLALVASDGTTIIDSVSFPKQKADISYARTEDGIGKWKFADHTTPNTSNVTEHKEGASERFAKDDPNGFVLTIIAMSVVFVALIFLYIFFASIGKIGIYIVHKKETSRPIIGMFNRNEKVETEVTGEIVAAISVAISQYYKELDNMETAVLTINKIARIYSPWSSKNYTLREIPRKK